MKLETFFDNFEVLAEAPNGVKKLHELILQLAVRGKLVAQDERDEPASVSIEKIRNEREQLVKEKKIKKLKLTPPIENFEGPYQLPHGWEWIRFGEIRDCIDNAIVDGPFGSNLLLSDYDDNGEYPVLTISNFDNGFDLKNIRKINERKFCELKRSTVYPGDILMAKIGSSYGKTCIYPEWMPIGMIPANILKITPHPKINKFYVLYFLKSPIFKLQLDRIVKITAQPAFNVSEFKNLVFALPPENEQKLIVSKVDQHMSLCDELEARQKKKRESRAHINSAALDRLLAARAPGEFAQGWQRISDNFDLLYDSPENVGALRQAILQLAVMGKLVEQNEKEETALVLLEKIKTQKEQLIKEKKIKKIELKPLIEKAEIPYDLPNGWEWRRFYDVATIASNLVQPRSYFDMPHIAPDNIEKQTGRLLSYQTVREDNVRSGNHRFFSGQIIYSKIRPNLSKATIVDFDGLCSADMYPINAHIDSKYLLKYMLSRTFLSMSVKNDTRVAMPKINQNELNMILVSVPPFEEQRRIVSKVDQLMSLCDKLEAGLMRSQADSERLMEAVVGRMLAGGDK